MPGSRLPSTRALAAELGLSRGTVTAAYEQLTAEGYLIAARGSGTIVGVRTPAPAASRRTSPIGTTPPSRYDLRPGSLVFEDDYDGEFRYDRKPTMPISTPHHSASWSWLT